MEWTEVDDWCPKCQDGPVEKKSGLYRCWMCGNEWSEQIERREHE